VMSLKRVPEMSSLVRLILLKRIPSCVLTVRRPEVRAPVKLVVLIRNVLGLLTLVI